MGAFQHPISQRGLAVVNVRYYAEVAYLQGILRHIVGEFCGVLVKLETNITQNSVIFLMLTKFVEN